MLFDSSTVITPSFPTFSIASEMSFPISSSPAETLATFAIFSLDSIFTDCFFSDSIVLATAFLIPFCRIIGFEPAAKFFKPALIIACARRVAVVVPSPATSFVFVATSLKSCAPIFSALSSSSISLAIVTPSFVMSGEPYALSRTTFLPLGPSVTFTVSASLFMPVSIFERASLPYNISLAIIISPLFYNCQNVRPFNYQICFAFIFYFSA